MKDSYDKPNETDKTTDKPKETIEQKKIQTEKEKTKSEEIFIISPTEKHTATIICVHEFSSTGKEFSIMLKSIIQPHIKYIFPTAPNRLITRENVEKRAWFDLLEGYEDKDGITDAATDILKLVENEVKNGIPANKIALLGDAHGGALCLYAAASSSYVFACVIVVNAYLPYYTDLDEYLNSDPQKLKYPIHIFAGEKDEITPTEYSETAKKKLSFVGFSDVHYKLIDDMKHYPWNKELEKTIKNLIESNVQNNENKNQSTMIHTPETPKQTNNISPIDETLSNNIGSNQTLPNNYETKPNFIQIIPDISPQKIEIMSDENNKTNAGISDKKPGELHELKPAEHHEKQPDAHHEVKPVEHHEKKPDVHDEVKLDAHDEKKPTEHHDKKPDAHLEVKPTEHHEKKPDAHHEVKPAENHEKKTDAHHEGKPAEHNEKKPDAHHENKPAEHHEKNSAEHHDKKLDAHHEKIPAEHHEKKPDAHHEKKPSEHHEVDPVVDLEKVN